MESLVLFVCTGNTCRSPMAEALLRSALPTHTAWRTASSGLSASEGSPASPLAVAALREVGTPLTHHRSQPVTPQLVRTAAVIVVMTAAHRQHLLSRFPEARDRLFLLRDFAPESPQPRDLADPFCGSIDDYRRCRDLIRETIPELVRFLTQAPGTPAN